MRIQELIPGDERARRDAPPTYVIALYRVGLVIVNQPQLAEAALAVIDPPDATRPTGCHHPLAAARAPHPHHAVPLKAHTGDLAAAGAVDRL